MSEEILVVGAGPVGLVMAAELARHGIRARIIDKADGPSPFCRAIGVTPRSLEVLEDMGVARELIDAGLWLDGTRVLLAGQPPRDALNDYDDLPFAQLGVPQYATETVLARHLATYGITPERGVALAGLTQDGDGITVELDTPAGRESARFRYVIGCDGAHSTVRKALGIEFEGEGWPFDFMIGDMHVDWEVPRGLAVRAIKPIEGTAPDFFVAIPLPERGRYRLSTIAPERLTRAEPSGDDVQHGIQSDRPSGTLADFQEVADRLLADRAVLTDIRWSSVFRISLRLAQQYRVGNAFIAGDACHIHPPTGGQGMNTGIQDAYNLAWKLALVAQGRADPALLDTYEGERRPVALGVLERTYEATINFGRETRKPDRLEDTQLLVSYAEGPLAVGPGTGRIAPGERIPDVHGLRRHGFGFPLRLFDVLRGPRHVLLVPLADGDTWRVEACAAGVRKSFGDLIRVVAIAPGDAKVEEPPGVELIYDAGGAFAAAFGAEPGDAFLVRPDNYLGRHLRPWAECGVVGYLRDTLGLTPAA